MAFEGLQEGAVHGFHGDRLFSFVPASVAPVGPVADDNRPSGYLSTIAIFTLVARTRRSAERAKAHYESRNWVILSLHLVSFIKNSSSMSSRWRVRSARYENHLDAKSVATKRVLFYII